MFVALNWPTNDRGEQAPALTDSVFGLPRWTLWTPTSQLYRSDGKAPLLCGENSSAAFDLTLPVSPGLAPFKVKQNFDHRRLRLLGVLSSVREINAANLKNITEPEDAPLIDQHGQFVYYESLLDPNETQYVCENQLYNANGQSAFTRSAQRIDFPPGEETRDSSGAFAVKLAWKIIDKAKGDQPSRFFTLPAKIMDLSIDGLPIERDVTVGLVGMHIAHKSQSAPQWIWTSFEQIDNLAVDMVSNPDIRPSFNDPACQLCIPNQPLIKTAAGGYERTPVQVARSVSIPPDLEHLNAQAEAVFAKLGSVWQYYQLVGAQWPSVPASPPASDADGLTSVIINRSGGAPLPAFIANVTMETYLQSRIRPACQLENHSQSCSETPDQGLSPQTSGVSADRRPVFGSTSCMACHSSAAIITGSSQDQFSIGAPLSGDFSWLLADKARFEMRDLDDTSKGR